MPTTCESFQGSAAAGAIAWRVEGRIDIRDQRVVRLDADDGMGTESSVSDPGFDETSPPGRPKGTMTSRMNP